MAVAALVLRSPSDLAAVAALAVAAALAALAALCLRAPSDRTAVAALGLAPQAEHSLAAQAEVVLNLAQANVVVDLAALVTVRDQGLTLLT